MPDYLPLTDYSTKYRVSLSTLRRRIKSEDILFRFQDGKYLILDAPMGSHQRTLRPSPMNMSDDSLMSAPSISEPVKTPPPETKTTEEPILTAANRLLTELKKAYTQILQEKEEQILYLKDEVADLKTLVRVLESENERLKKNLF